MDPRFIPVFSPGAMAALMSTRGARAIQRRVRDHPEDMPVLSLLYWAWIAMWIDPATNTFKPLL